MKEKNYIIRYKWILVLMLLGSAVILPIINFCAVMDNHRRMNSYCTNLEYGYNTELSDDGEYIGIMYNRQEVLIMGRNGERVSEFLSASGPDEIALGEKVIFYYIVVMIPIRRKVKLFVWIINPTFWKKER